MKTIAVFLVDDHAVLRQGLRVLVDAQPDMRVVGESGSGKNLTEVVQRSEANVVVMDVSMPDFNGARATVELKRALPGMIVLALTRHTERAYLQQMLESGAAGYVLKQAPAADVIHAIRTVSAGGTYVDPLITGKLIPRHRSQPATGHPLTQREQEVVTMIALGHTSKEIASALNISVKTVQAHKSNVMSKLDMTSRADLIRFAMLQGWLESS